MINRFGRLLVNIAYQLDKSTRYRHLKDTTWDLLENPHSRWRWWVDGSMILLVLASVLLYVLAIRFPMPTWTMWFEKFALAVFVLEYLARWWLATSIRRTTIEAFEQAELGGYRFRARRLLRRVVAAKLRYMVSPLAIIDLLAIVPSYRPVRFLRIFLLFRLFKLFRYVGSVNTFVGVLREKRMELGILALFMGFILITSSTAIYIFEADEAGSQIDSIFDAFYWSLVTLSTVGYGDITPVTVEGKVVAMLLIVTGISVVAFLTSIIVSGFSGRIDELRTNRTLVQLHRGHHWMVLFGFGRLGAAVVRHLNSDYRSRILVVDDNLVHVERARVLGLTALELDAKQGNELEQVLSGVAISHVLCLTDDDVANVFTTLSMRRLAPEAQIIARINDPHHISKLYHAGADRVVSSADVVAEIAAEYVGQPVAFEAIQALLSPETQFEVDTIMVHANCAIERRLVEQLEFAAFKLRLIGVVPSRPDGQTSAGAGMSLTKSRLYFNPPPGFSVRAGDLLVVLGHRRNITLYKERRAIS